MQSIDQRLGGSLPILKPTDQNLSYAFEGDAPELETSCKSIAKALVKKGVLIENPIADGKKVYSAAVLAGDGAKIDAFKKDIREKQGTTAKLVSEGPAVATALSLTPALRLRYALDIDSGKLPVVTVSDFKKAMDVLKSKDQDWHFYAVLALAKTEDEAQTFRTLIKNTVADPTYKNITVIDALSTPLGLEAFEQYVDYSAMSLYYIGNNGQQSKENAKKAKDVLERDWKDRIHDGQFIVFTYANQDGEKATGAGAVQTILQTIVLNRFKHVQDFTKGLSESQLKLTSQKQVARYGMGGVEIKGVIKGCETSVLGKVWSKKEYWNDESLAGEHIVIIKKAIDKMITDAFNSNGKISIGEIYDCLETTFGFSVCNLSAFITGFLLKEYSSEPYRSMDAEGHRDAMTPDKLAEMIGNYYGKSPNPDSKGIITPEALESIITDNTRLVSIMYSNNEIGTIEPVKELAQVAHRHGALFHTDAVQAIGHIGIDVKALDVDMLSASAHKFNGPKGVGFLYIRKGIKIASFNDGGSQESGLRAGTENIASVVGMAIALRNNLAKLSENEAHILKLEQVLLSELSGFDFVRNGAESHVPGNISLSFKNRDGEAILHRLDLAGICVSTGSACDSVNTRISHVLKAIGLDDSYAKGTIRISLGKDNTVDDVKAIATALKRILLP